MLKVAWVLQYSSATFMTFQQLIIIKIFPELYTLFYQFSEIKQTKKKGCFAIQTGCLDKNGPST